MTVIPMVLVWAVLAWGILALLRSPRGNASPATLSHLEPKEILARRFAAGEIDEADFDRRLAVLRGTSEHAVSAQ